MSAVLSIVPSPAQIQALAKLGVTEVPLTKADASTLISRAIATRDMRPASQASIGKLAVLGGRDLPGAGQREVSTAIAIVEAMYMVDLSEGNESERTKWLEELVLRVRTRLTKPMVVQARHEDATVEGGNF